MLLWACGRYDETRQINTAPSGPVALFYTSNQATAPAVVTAVIAAVEAVAIAVGNGAAGVRELTVVLG